MEEARSMELGHGSWRLTAGETASYAIWRSNAAVVGIRRADECRGARTIAVADGGAPCVWRFSGAE
jgi:hypothetical protein